MYYINYTFFKINLFQKENLFTTTTTNNNSNNNNITHSIIPLREYYKNVLNYARHISNNNYNYNVNEKH